MTRYLREHACYGPLIDRPAPPDLGMVVAVPAKDEPDLIAALESLRACERPRVAVEVIVVVNTSVTDSPECVAENQRIAEAASRWAENASAPGLHFDVLQAHGLRKKHAGVGLARKIGMDEACRRLEAAANPAGVIACFDADSRCDRNYLVELAALFREDEDLQACSIYFEHPIEGDEFPPETYSAIVLYELHLRYFVEAQRHAGFPFATHAVGSSMAVRCSAYQDQNGMNRRQAGEDFYFFHKFTPLGQVAELVSTCVMPSPRRSHRVPFGTGKAVATMLDSRQDPAYQTYSPRSFEDLRRFFMTVDALFDRSLDRARYIGELPESIARFVASRELWPRVEEMRANVTTLATFRLRFFKWFNAFLVMKFLHGARDHCHPDTDVCEAARWLLRERHGHDELAASKFSPADLLAEYRAIERARSSDLC